MGTTDEAGAEEVPITRLAPPWCRYWARGLDVFFSDLLVSVVVVAIWPSLVAPDGAFGGDYGGQRLGWVLLPVAMLADAVMYATFGNTLGKWIAGIKVVEVDGGKVPLWSYVKRNYAVWWLGLGTGFPLVGVFTLASCYKRATRGELMSWDVSSKTRNLARTTSPVRTWLAATSYLVLLAGSLVTQALPTKAVGVEEELRSAAASANKGVPIMVDNATRLDRVEAGPGPNFTYHYTLIGVNVDSLPAGAVAQFKGPMNERLRNNVCKDEALAEVLRRGVTIHYDYADHNGRMVVAFSFERSDCGG